MKEYLKTLIQSSPSPVEAHNLSREYLQALILQSLQRVGAMTTIAFHGGTSLRFLYSLPRFYRLQKQCFAAFQDHNYQGNIAA